MPFAPVDFRKRAWVVNSGWPLQYEDLQPYYPIANQFMQIDALDYEHDVLRLLHLERPAFDRDKAWYHFAKWAPEPNFRKLHGTELAEKVTVVYNAVLTKINLDGRKRVHTIRISNFKDKTFDVPVQTLIIATGGIETNRILLSNNHQVAGGIGSDHGWLGKCFMEHPCIDVGLIKTAQPYKLQSYFNTHVAKRRRYSIRLSTPEKLQQQCSLLNGSASIMFDYDNDAFDPYLEIRNFVRTKRFSGFKGLLSNAAAYRLSAKALLQDKFFYKHGARARLVMMLEQEPLTDSFIELGDKKDRFGMNLARVNWKISKMTWNTVLSFSTILGDELRRLSFGELTTHPHITPGNEDWEACLTDVNHHMGGTRMSDLPENGVTNKDLQVWGHENLFVCSSSLYPTGSHSNPTLTLLALCLRLVDFLAPNHQ
jgi:choline dehydrogenase-like flavoprotein